MAVKLNSAGGGSVTLDVPSTASTFSQTVPAVSGTLVTTGDTATVTPTMLSQKLTQGTVQASTSGTTVPFTGIPSWAKRITMMLNQVTLNTSSSYIYIQVGSGSFNTTGYVSQTWSSTSPGVITSGLIIGGNVGSNTYALTGVVVLDLFGSNTWLSSGLVIYDNVSSTGWGSSGRTPALSGSLDRIQLTAGGTVAFTGGSVNILYEG